jgi:hypothetical protein
MLLSVAALLALWCIPFHLRYREQMEAIAAVERLGGSVGARCDAPMWLQRLQPEYGWGPAPLGPAWLRQALSAKFLSDHFLVVEDVSLDNGRGLHLGSDYSGQRRDIHPVPTTDDDLAWVAKFSELQGLDLRNTAIGDAGIRRLRNLKNVKSLRLDETQITDDSLDIIARCEKLETLSLSNTRITDASLAKLERLSNLEYLDVSWTQVSEKGLRRASDHFVPAPTCN